MRKIETIRAELESAQQELAALETAALLIPLDQALAGVDALIGECANRARTFIAKGVRPFADRTGNRPAFIDWEVTTPTGALTRMQDVAALMAPDVLREELTAAVREMYVNDPGAMSETDRQAAATKTRQKVDKLEREEYQVSVATGVPIRLGTRPELVLGLE